MNSYIVEESENRRFLGAIFLSVLVHAALFLLLKTTGLGFGYSLVGMGRADGVHAFYVNHERRVGDPFRVVKDCVGRFEREAGCVVSARRIGAECRGPASAETPS